MLQISINILQLWTQIKPQYSDAQKYSPLKDGRVASRAEWVCWSGGVEEVRGRLMRQRAAPESH